MRMTNRDRRDWSLLIFIVPIGILLMMIAGWFALWVVPQWSLQAGMGSSLEVGAADSQSGPRPLINPQILTPFSWLGSYLTPSGDDPFFVPFVVIQPSATPSASVVPATTETPPVSVTVSPPVTVVTTPPANTSTTTATNKPPDDEGTPPAPTTCQDSAATNYGGALPCTYPPTTCQDPAATNFGGPLPCTYPPTTCQDPAATNFGGALPCTYPPTTCQDPAATNFGGPLPCTYPPTTCQDPAATNFGGALPCAYPPTTCQDPAATNFGGPLPCTYPPTTCQDPAATNFGGALPCAYPPTTCQDPAATNFGGPLPCIYPPTGVVSTIPASYGTPAPIPSEVGVGTTPDNSIGEIQDQQYIVIGISVIVGSTSDNNYDLALYENNNSSYVYMDWIIVGISNMSDGSQYYEVFNWGNGTADDNSNVGDVAGTEGDNQQINLSELYDPDGAGPAPQTGILIDVDEASSDPPPDTYQYVVIISPVGGSGDPAQIDSVQVVEVPTPTP